MARPSKHDGVLYKELAARFGGCGTAIVMANAYLESTNTEEWQEAQRKLRERLQARDESTLQTSCARVNNCFSTDGWTFFWRTTPSLRFGRQ